MLRKRLENLFFIFTYILMILVILLGAVFYRQPLLSILLLLVLFLPPLSLRLTSAAIRRLTFSVELPTGEIRTPQELLVHIAVENPTPLPLLNVRLRIRYRNLYFHPEIDTPAEELVVAAEARRSSRYTLPFQTAAAGMFLFDIEGVEVTDLLHFHTFRLPYTWHGALPILPAEREIADFPLSKAAVESEDAVSSPEGELTSELLQLREYRPGDRLKDIHWKLTAKTEELMVKEYDRAKDLYYLLLPELSADSLQETIAAFYALGQRLLKRRESYRIALYDPSDHSFDTVRVENLDALQTALYRIYQNRVEHRSTAYTELLRQFPELAGVIRIADGKVLPPALVESY